MYCVRQRRRIVSDITGGSADRAGDSNSTGTGIRRTGDGCHHYVGQQKVRKPEKAEITSVKLLIGADSLVLDLDEKKENLSSQVVSANNIFTTKDIQIYTEPAGLVEVGDIERNGEQNVHFSLTGKTAGTGKLYLASADGSVVSEPVEFTVRTAEEKEQAERPIYYTPLGDYWHYSEDCAREDYPDATYDWHGNRRGVDRTDVPVMKMPQGRAFGDKTPCPKCAAEE